MNISQKMIQHIKQLLREHSMTYSQLAGKLQLSESTVKRMFSTESMSLRRFGEILETMNVDIDQLFARIQQESTPISELSIAQEHALLQDTKLLLVCFLTLNHWPLSEISRIYAIDDYQLTTLLANLDRIGIIELGVGNRIKPLVSRNFKWRKNGPVEHFFAKTIQPEFLDSTFEQAGEKRHFISGMLSRSSIVQLHKQLDRLSLNVDELVNLDSNLPVSERYGVSILLAFRPWEHQSFSQLRRQANTKYIELAGFV